MSAEASTSASNAQGVFVYMGQGSVVPMDVTNVRVHPSVRVVARGAFAGCSKLVEVELCEGLEEIGKEAFQHCKLLKRITIPSSVRRIADIAFWRCVELVKVELCEGLEEIGNGAFIECKCLKRIAIPSSVRRIAEHAFGGCSKLVALELCEGIEEIEDGAFCNCNSLRNIAIPSSVRVIGRQAFSGCTGLLMVELREGLQEIEYKAFYNCTSLRHIAIPSSVRVISRQAFHECTGLVVVVLCEGIEEIEGGAFRNCKSLRSIAIPSTCQVGERVFEGAFPSEDISVISEALKHRFDGLPIHQLCYYQQYHPTNNILQHLEEVMGPPDQPNITGTQQDCFGMMPLHILACSTKHDMDLYQLLTEKYPNNLITEDKWGDLPILYAFWGNAPRGVVQLLVEGHKSYFPDHALDWGRMVVTLGEANEPDGIRNLFKAQQNHLPDQNINWEECAVELARSQSASIGTFQCFLRLSVANRLDALGVEIWQGKVENFIDEFSVQWSNAREERAGLLYSNLTSCEQLKEATWLLELALWKAKLDDSASNIRVSNNEERYQCRINCGVQQILPVVVSFLSPKWESSL